MKPIRNIFVIDPPNLGEKKTIYAISNALCTHFSAKEHFCKVNRSNSILRRILPAIVRSSSFVSLCKYPRFKDFFLRRVLGVSFPQNIVPCLVISSHQPRLLAAAALARASSAEWVHLGISKQVINWKTSLNTVISIPGTDQNVSINVVGIDVFPSKIIKKETPVLNKELKYAVFLGGNTRETKTKHRYNYLDRNWEDIIKFLRVILANSNVKIMLTTSPRTGKGAEAIIDRALQGISEKIHKKVFFSSKPHDVMDEFLANCCLAFCTEDSLSMISDIVLSGTPCYTLRLKQARLKKKEQIFLENLERKRLIKRIDIDQQIDAKDFMEKFVQYNVSWSSLIIDNFNKNRRLE